MRSQVYTGQVKLHLRYRQPQRTALSSRARDSPSVRPLPGLAPDVVPYDMSGKEGHTVRIPVTLVENMPELKENPFRQQICKVFTEGDHGHMTFEEFLDMFSVFSEAAPRDIKAVYAFKIYDWDEDGYLNKADLKATLLKLTKDGLDEEEVQFVIDKVLEEADLDDDGMLSYIEFEHVISRAPDFLK
ncbi:hypothetical protein C0Q70_19886 [Pomacea canaliculata]|uniref:EF-hand domain-containing protein n=1 Tax=Pomacea canaliculata TaxID=400727 RepID=A0A2T7NDZ7_POMCA|nr:hypothetical protein C0Q70_19886 [Pomacea canaliculata]